MGDAIQIDSLDLTEPNGFLIESQSYPTPFVRHDRTCHLTYENRSITLGIKCDHDDARSQLAAKVKKIAREGGTLKRTFPGGDWVVFDLLAAKPTPTGLHLTAKPYGRGPVL